MRQNKVALGHNGKDVDRCADRANRNGAAAQPLATLTRSELPQLRQRKPNRIVPTPLPSVLFAVPRMLWTPTKTKPPPKSKAKTR
jgi:hypothetical protein